MGAPPCTPVLPTECRRRSPLLLPPPSRSRSLLPLRGSTLYGSVAPSWPPYPPSSRCGSPSRIMTSPVLPSCTENVSKHLLVYFSLVPAVLYVLLKKTLSIFSSVC